MKCFFGTRMHKPKFPRMKRLTGKCFHSRPRLAVQTGHFRTKSRPIHRISDQRMADMRHMDADLMGASGFKAAGDKSNQRLAIPS